MSRNNWNFLELTAITSSLAILALRLTVSNSFVLRLIDHNAARERYCRVVYDIENSRISYIFEVAMRHARVWRSWC